MTVEEYLAERLENEIRPLIAQHRPEGYNCCGCSTYDAILDHAIRIVKGEEAEPAQGADNEGSGGIGLP